MTKEEFEALQPGDIVRHKRQWQNHIITGNYGGRVTAVRTVDLTQPHEWEKIERPAK